MVLDRAVRVLRLLWALPCSLVGLALALVLLAMGGSARRVGPTLEVALAPHSHQLPPWVQRLRFGGITFGHVILGHSHEVLAVLRAHERVHVRQYEAWGLLFFVAYPAASLLAWLGGECPYAGNRFERLAVAGSGPPVQGVGVDAQSC